MFKINLWESSHADETMKDNIFYKRKVISFLGILSVERDATLGHHKRRALSLTECALT